MKNIYPLDGDSPSCLFPGVPFGSVDVSESTDSTLRVKYTGLLEAKSITIKCFSFRNPILPEQQ